MKFRKFLAAFLAICMLLPVLCLSAAAGNDDSSSDSETIPSVETLSEAALLVEADSGTILYDKNSDAALFPASVTKVMTVLLACEYIEDGIVGQDDIVTVTEDAWYLLESDSSNASIDAGEQISFLNLMYCAMLASANEACNAIAIHCCGDIATFVTEMNRRAAALGCKNTHFVTTNGLHDDNHYTTAYDMYLIVAEAIKHPLFKQIFGTESYTVPATNDSPARYISHTNRLLNQNHANYYPYCTGGKTGSTSNAGYCLVSTAEKDGLTLICIILGAGRTSESGSYTLNTYIDSIALYNWGFENFSYQTVLSAGESVAEIPVYMGDRDSVGLIPEQDVRILLPNKYPSEKLSVSVTLADGAENGSIKAPVKRGEALGEITVYYDGDIYATVKGTAEYSVSLKHTEFIKEELSETFSLDWVRKFITFFVFIFIFYAAYIILYSIIHRIRHNRSFYRARSYAAMMRAEAAEADAEAMAKAEGKKKSEQQDNSGAASGKTAVFTMPAPEADVNPGKANDVASDDNLMRELEEITGTFPVYVGAAGNENESAETADVFPDSNTSDEAQSAGDLKPFIADNAGTADETENMQVSTDGDAGLTTECTKNDSNP